MTYAKDERGIWHREGLKAAAKKLEEAVEQRRGISHMLCQRASHTGAQSCDLPKSHLGPHHQNLNDIPTYWYAGLGSDGKPGGYLDSDHKPLQGYDYVLIKSIELIPCRHPNKQVLNVAYALPESYADSRLICWTIDTVHPGSQSIRQIGCFLACCLGTGDIYGDEVQEILDALRAALKANELVGVLKYATREEFKALDGKIYRAVPRPYVPCDGD